MVFLAAAVSWAFLYLLAEGIFVLLALSTLGVPRRDLPPSARQHWLSGFAGWKGFLAAYPAGNNSEPYHSYSYQFLPIIMIQFPLPHTQ